MNSNFAYNPSFSQKTITEKTSILVLSSQILYNFTLIGMISIPMAVFREITSISLV
jgi:hypothetical protein